MKNTTIPRLTLVLALLGAGMVPAQSANTTRVGSYDFSYFLSGDARAKPVQAFDDGRYTYFQFRAGEAVPAIFATRDGVPQLLVPTQEGPYVKVPQMHGRFLLQVGRAQAHVVHAGSQASPDAPRVSLVAPTGLSAPYAGGEVASGARLVASLDPVPMKLDAPLALDRNSYATPTRGDQVYWTDRASRVEHSVGFSRAGWTLSRDAQRTVQRLAQGAGPKARFVVVGRDDESFKEGLEQARAQSIRTALVKAGVAADRITVQAGVMKADHKGQVWESTVYVDSPQAAPVMERAPAAAPRATARVDSELANRLEALVRAGTLDRAAANAVLARSEPAAAPVAKPAAPVARSFAMRKADQTIEKMLQRWSKDTGWKVLWQGAPVIAITDDAQIDRADFLQAADVVVKGINAAGYRVKATAYSNNVLQIVGE